MRPLRHENPLLRGLERLLIPKNAHWNDEHPVGPVVIDKAHHQLGSWKPPAGVLSGGSGDLQFCWWVTGRGVKPPRD